MADPSPSPSSSSPPSDAPPTEQQGSVPECPFCVMMRKGGCEETFKAFMDCGERAEKGSHEMSDCVPFFESLHECMERNKGVFDVLLEEMKAEQGGDKAAGGEEPAAKAAVVEAAAAGGGGSAEAPAAAAAAPAPAREAAAPAAAATATTGAAAPA